MPWSQNYHPVGGVGVSALIAVLPVAVMLALLAFWHVRAHRAALVALLVAGAIAVFVYGMPFKLAVAAAGYGAAFGLLPIGWLILNAIFIYQLSVETGQFVVLQKQIAGISRDRRIQALLLAFAFGAFIEGAAGFGAPVAISGALMIGLGFSHRARPAGAQRRGRPADFAFRVHPAILAHRRTGRLAPHGRSLAGLPHGGRHLRDHPVYHE
jgi:lactate permease